MINFLFGLFQSLNALRYTYRPLWRLKVDIWLSLSSLQFTDTFQVLCFLYCLLKANVFWKDKKRNIYTCVYIYRYTHTQVYIYIYIHTGVYIHVYIHLCVCVYKACYLPCGPELFLLLPLCSDNLLLQSSSTQSQEKPLHLLQSWSLVCYSQEYKSAADKMNKNSNQKEFCA